MATPDLCSLLCGKTAVRFSFVQHNLTSTCIFLNDLDLKRKKQNHVSLDLAQVSAHPKSH